MQLLESIPARFPSHDTSVGTLKYTVFPVVMLTILTPAPSRGTTATLHTGHHEESAGPREPSWVVPRVHRLHLDGDVQLPHKLPQRSIND